ncbi:hypothetical protein LINPERHAP2_LOCUS4109 [Linum perenne]
MRHWLIPT